MLSMLVMVQVVREHIAVLHFKLSRRLTVHAMVKWFCFHLLQQSLSLGACRRS